MTSTQRRRGMTRAELLAPARHGGHRHRRPRARPRPLYRLRTRPAWRVPLPGPPGREFLPRPDRRTAPRPGHHPRGPRLSTPGRMTAAAARHGVGLGGELHAVGPLAQRARCASRSRPRGVSRYPVPRSCSTRPAARRSRNRWVSTLVDMSGTLRREFAVGHRARAAAPTRSAAPSVARAHRTARARSASPALAPASRTCGDPLPSREVRSGSDQHRSGRRLSQPVKCLDFRCGWAH